MVYRKRKIRLRRRRRRKVVRKRRPQSLKIAALIAYAIRDLRETKGSTSNKIIGYITHASNMPEGRVKRQVTAALKRGVEYGILRKYRGHYFLPSSDEMERANRIAVRFARLPTPGPQPSKSKSVRRPSTVKDYRRSRVLRVKSHKTRKPRSTLSLPSTTSVNFMNKIKSDHILPDNTLK